MQQSWQGRQRFGDQSSGIGPGKVSSLMSTMLGRAMSSVTTKKVPMKATFEFAMAVDSWSFVLTCMQGLNRHLYSPPVLEGNAHEAANFALNIDQGFDQIALIFCLWAIGANVTQCWDVNHFVWNCGKSAMKRTFGCWRHSFLMCVVFLSEIQAISGISVFSGDQTSWRSPLQHVNAYQVPNSGILLGLDCWGD